MIDLLLKAIDRIIELAKIHDKRLRARFEEIHKPSFGELQAVHEDYLSLFTELRTKLCALSKESPQLSKVLLDTAQALRTRRVALLPLRQKLWALSSFVIEGTSMNLPEEELAFLSSIIDYFVVGGAYSFAYRSRVTLMLESLEEVIALELKNNASSTQSDNCGVEAPSISKVLHQCDTDLDHLQMKFETAARRFNALRLLAAQSVA